MHLRRIEIRNFRKLREPVRIDLPDDSLCVIAGDNEEGKSTVLAAIQAAFFIRHGISGKAAEAMQPFGSAVRPEVAVEFDLKGARYTLTKGFCQSKSAELVTPSGTLAGDAAEERLQDLLTFTPPKRGAGDAEQRGVWGLFWVDQGESFRPPPLGADGRETIVDTLDSEVGQVLGGERGRRLRARIEELYAEAYDKRGRPRGEWEKTRKRLDDLDAEVARLTGELTQYERKVDDLARIRTRLAAYERDGTQARAEAALTAARAEAARIEALRQRLEAAQNAEKLASLTQSAADKARADRQALITSLAAVGDNVERLDTAVRSARAAAEERQAAREAAQAACDSERAARDRAAAVWDAAEHAVRRARTESELAAAEQRLAAAREAQETADDRRAAARAIALEEADLKALRRLDQEAEAARIRLETVATRLAFAPEPGRRVLRDGVPVDTTAPLQVTAETTLALDGFGRLTVLPGGEDLATLRAAAERSAGELAAMLARCAVADVAAAATLLQSKRDHLAAAATQEAVLKTHAPEGMDALSREVTLKRAQRRELAPDEAAEPLPLAEAEMLRDRARAGRDAAATAFAAAETRLKAAEQAWAAARDTAGRAEAEHGMAARQQAQAEAELAAARDHEPDDRIAANLAAQTAALDAAKAETARCAAELEAADPEAARLGLEQAADAVETIAADLADLRGRAHTLDVELRTLGQPGQGEHLQERMAERQRTERAAARLERHAGAVRLLRDTLATAERAARETFLGPVRERVEPYLKLLFPGAQVVIGDDDLAVAALCRDGVAEPFESLSLGTREQLAVVARLAFADYLRAKDKPALIILDDALAYADETRFERMQRVLRRAAESVQVIVLTCRERDYVMLGAPIIRLADCRLPPP